MTVPQWITLVSAILGAAGTLVLFQGSHALEAVQGSFFGSTTTDADAEATRVRNIKRMRIQRIGLCLILLSFVVQGLGALA